MPVPQSWKSNHDQWVPRHTGCSLPHTVCQGYSVTLQELWLLQVIPTPPLPANPLHFRLPNIQPAYGPEATQVSKGSAPSFLSYCGVNLAGGHLLVADGAVLHRHRTRSSSTTTLSASLPPGTTITTCHLAPPSAISTSACLNTSVCISALLLACLCCWMLHASVSQLPSTRRSLQLSGHKRFQTVGTTRQSCGIKTKHDP